VPRVKRLLAVTVLIAGSAQADFMDHFVIREDVGPHKAPSQGRAEVVVVPVEVMGFPSIDTAALEAFFGDESTDGFVPFYKTASLGRYTPHVTVAQKVVFDACPLPAAQFPKCEVARGDIAAFSAGLDMIREVVKRAHDQGTDFSKFDVNGKKGVADGWADGVMLLTNVGFGGIAFPFGYFNRGDNLAGGMGGPLIVDGVKIPHVAIAGYSDQWVMVHEFGHLLGLTDLYDESGQYDGLQPSWMGSWGYDPKIPLPDAETRWRLRWGDWHQVSGRQTVVVKPAEKTGEIWRLGTGDEYFLVENRGPGGAFDKAITTRGLLVYHVDRALPQLSGDEGRFQDRILRCVNCEPWHPYIMWVQADGKFEVQTGGKPDWANDVFRDEAVMAPEGSGTSLGPDHKVLSTNFYSGKISGLSIQDIHVNADDTISVTFEAPEEGQCGESLCADGVACAPSTCANPGPSQKPGCGVASGWLAALALVGLFRPRFRAS
jgi:M6 family metalloprotease-like protein